VLEQEVKAFEAAKMDEAQIAEYFLLAHAQIMDDQMQAQQAVLDKLAKAQKEAAEQAERDWRDAHAQQLEWSERFADGFAGQIAQMVTTGKASLEDFGQFFRQMLAGMLQDVMSSRIQAWFENFLRARTSGGGGRGWEYEGVDVPGGGGGGGVAGRPGGGGGGGGMMPMPVPNVNVNTAPVIYVTNRIRSDVSDVGCETVVTRGLNRMQRIGR